MGNHSPSRKIAEITGRGLRGRTPLVEPVPRPLLVTVLRKVNTGLLAVDLSPQVLHPAKHALEEESGEVEG